MPRRYWGLMHRYAGLAMAGFLIVEGLTGSVLAFLPELEHALNPQFYVADTGAPRLDAATLIEKAEGLAPRAQAESIWLGEPDPVQVNLTPRLDPATGRPNRLDYDQLVLDPHTGEELGRYTYGAIGQGWGNLLSFVYRLHYTLALGDTGGWILGIAAMAWTIDCFVALYLTLPARKRGRSPLADTRPRAYLQRWKPAWQVKWKASPYRINFDLHRAGGLWLWVLLLIFAWSSVYMNLGPVYTAVTRLALDYRDPWTDLPLREKLLEQPVLHWREAEALGRGLMARAGAVHGFSVERPVSFRIDRAHGVYIYQVRSSLDFQDRYGATQVFFDADTGEQRMLLLPRGQFGGNTVTAWLYALHKANVFGLSYRIVVCALGVAIVMLSLTGIVIWLRKRRAHRHHLASLTPSIEKRMEEMTSRRISNA